MFPSFENLDHVYRVLYIVLRFAYRRFSTPILLMISKLTLFFSLITWFKGL